MHSMASSNLKLDDDNKRPQEKELAGSSFKRSAESLSMNCSCCVVGFNLVLYLRSSAFSVKMEGFLKAPLPIIHVGRERENITRHRVS